MATKIKDSRLNQGVQKDQVKPQFKWLLLAAMTLIAAVTLGFLWATSPAAENASNIQRTFEADAARYTAMAEFYLANDAANRQRAVEADAARYTAMAEFYLADDAANRQRAVEAEAARYTGLAEFFGQGGKW